MNIESCAQGGAYPVQNFAQLVELAQKRGPKTIAVAVAAQKAVSLAVNEAEEWGIADVILIGDQLPSTIHVRGDRLRIIVLRWALHL